ncbi:hypothetical protein GSI_07898 [Ganoderma sinense ZZ0214-1]|uniref:Uncharacterized protein n=1 Tax=Ganoderma sinense ZZ0214-1 TaxID=1077348 RepID=A0A2G8S8C5_9APHY|nr:hypothetical protein GSI_07898 [Ganoderma sinense ZZ0214-1]
MAPACCTSAVVLHLHLTHLHLTHLRVVFHYAVRCPRATQASTTQEEQNTVYTADETDLHAIATHVFDAMQTVRYILLATCGHTYRSLPRNEGPPGATEALNKWHTSKAWRRTADRLARRHEPSNGKTSPVVLSREATEKIVAQEELHLSRDEEVRTFILANLSS